LSVIAYEAREGAARPFEWKQDSSLGSNEQLGTDAGHAEENRIQREAFDDLFRRLWRASVEWARAAGAGSNELAEDAATQAWLRAWRYRHRFDSQRATYAAWLRSIVRNETMDLMRTEARHSSRRSDETIELIADPASVQQGDLFALSYLWEAFEELEAARPEFAAALKLKALGYPDSQIAQRSNLERVGTVGSRLFRAKRFLAERLAERGVVFLAGAADSPLGGLNLLCRTGDGGFYQLSPGSGATLHPKGETPRTPARKVADGFGVTVYLQERLSASGPAPGGCVNS
jgi:RNA polymerase sigma-70 factor (ECF subfamily)